MTPSGWHEFIPKAYLYLRQGYTLATFKKDLIAGLTVGIIALPLAMAFAVASGVNPERGIYTAIIAGFLISALGGSRVQIGGPTGAFVIIISGIVARTGYSGLCLSTLIAAVILIFLGLLRIGSWIRYVPHPLITGFTSGIAAVIFSTQIKDFFGLTLNSSSADIINMWSSYWDALPSINLTTASFSLATLGLILLIRKFIPKLPWGITAIIIGTLFCSLFNLPIETILSHFGAIPSHLPLPTLPSLNFSEVNWQESVTDGLAIAFLGAIESLLSATIGDGMIGGKHRSNCELVAQGAANMGSVFFGGIPATGAIARTAANVKTGAQTPMAGMIHALTLALILYCLAPLASRIPLATLSAILVMIAWDMSEIHHFRRLLKAPTADRIILLTAFLLTIFVNITVAISAGMILASFFFMKQMSQFSKAIALPQIFQESSIDFPEKTDPDDISKKQIPPGVEVYEIQGPFFFGSANILKDLLDAITTPASLFILRMRAVPVIDASGMYRLEEFYKQCEKKQITLLLSGVHGQTLRELKRFGLIDLIGAQQICLHIDAALLRAQELLSQDKSEA